MATAMGRHQPLRRCYCGGLRAFSRHSSGVKRVKRAKRARRGSKGACGLPNHRCQGANPTLSHFLCCPLVIVRPRPSSLSVLMVVATGLMTAERQARSRSPPETRTIDSARFLEPSGPAMPRALDRTRPPPSAGLLETGPGTAGKTAGDDWRNGSNWENWNRNPQRASEPTEKSYL